MGNSLGLCCPPQKPSIVADTMPKENIGVYSPIHSQLYTSFVPSLPSDKEIINEKGETRNAFIVASKDELSDHSEMVLERLSLKCDRVKLEDFNLMKVLGRGSFGKVMLVEKKDTGKLYAMKILQKEVIEKRNQIIHTKSERKIMETADHPFIVRLHYAFQTDRKLYLVTDFMKAGELFFHLRRNHRFLECRARLYAAEIILALEYLHTRGIIYRDLKPENVLLGADGHIKITDFGLSKQGLIPGEKSYTFCGTPEYLAPEILLGIGHNHAVDWWSLGALLYEMLSGAPPHFSKDKRKMFQNILEKPIEMKPYFSLEASSLLSGLLKVDPNERLGSSEDGADEIKKHPFFASIDWKLIYEKKVSPYFLPKLKGKLDLRYFDPNFTEESVKDTPVIANKTVVKTEHFSGFTYVKRDMTSSGSTSKIEESIEIFHTYGQNGQNFNPEFKQLPNRNVPGPHIME